MRAKHSTSLSRAAQTAPESPVARNEPYGRTSAGSERKQCCRASSGPLVSPNSDSLTLTKLLRQVHNDVHAAIRCS